MHIGKDDTDAARRVPSGRYVHILLAAALALIIMLAAPSAQTVNIPSGACSVPTAATQAQLQNIWNGEIPLAFIAVSMAFLIAAIIFMVGAAFKNDRIRNFGIGEIYEAIVTAAIVISFITVAALLFQTLPLAGINAVFSQGGPTQSSTQVTSPYVTATNGICNLAGNLETIYDTALNGASGNGYSIAGDLTGIFFPCLGNALSVGGYMNLQCLLGYSLSINIGDEITVEPLDIVNVALVPFLYATYVVPEQVVAGLTTDTLYLLWAEYYLMLCFEIMGPMFIAAGTVFRALLPTRALGGMLISVGVGFFIVMPVLLSIVFSIPTPPISPNGVPLGSISGSLNTLWVEIVIYPALAIALTYTFIMQLAAFIGATASMGGRLRAGFI